MLDGADKEKRTEKSGNEGRIIMVVQTIDDISFQMKEAFDFSFISNFGKVFRVFDKSSSGCICFGVEKDGNRYF